MFLKKKKNLSFAEILQPILPDLQDLANNLKRVSLLQPLNGIIPFFNCVSRWHDRLSEIDIIIEFLTKVNNKGQNTRLIDSLQALRAHFINAGRDKYAMNRTEKGQEVLAEDIFLGGIFGLWTQSLPVWLAQKNAPPANWEFPNLKGYNAFEVISWHTGQFMTSHVGPICKIVSELAATTS